MGGALPTAKPVKNQDLRMRLDLLASKHASEWRWERGHNGHAGNERLILWPKLPSAGSDNNYPHLFLLQLGYRPTSHPQQNQ